MGKVKKKSNGNGRKSKVLPGKKVIPPKRIPLSSKEDTRKAANLAARKKRREELANMEKKDRNRWLSNIFGVNIFWDK